MVAEIRVEAKKPLPSLPSLSSQPSATAIPVFVTQQCLTMHTGEQKKGVVLKFSWSCHLHFSCSRDDRLFLSAKNHIPSGHNKMLRQLKPAIIFVQAFAVRMAQICWNGEQKFICYKFVCFQCFQHEEKNRGSLSRQVGGNNVHSYCCC